MPTIGNPLSLVTFRVDRYLALICFPATADSIWDEPTNYKQDDHVNTSATDVELIGTTEDALSPLAEHKAQKMNLTSALLSHPLS